MANFDDPYKLLCYIRKTFIEHDETGLSGEFIGDKFPNHNELFPTSDSNDDDDEDSSSSEDYSDWELEKVDSKTNRSCGGISDEYEGMEERDGELKEDEACAGYMDGSSEELVFERTDVNKSKRVGRSLLSHQLEEVSPTIGNPFTEYAKYDGTSQFRADTRTFDIFLTMVPQSEGSYPLTVCITSSAKVLDLVGLICFKYTNDNPDACVRLKENVSRYCLYIANEHGEIDWEFPSLDPYVTIKRFYLQYLALVEMTDVNMHADLLKERPSTSKDDDDDDDDDQEDEASNLARLENTERFMEGLRTMAALIQETFHVTMARARRRKMKVAIVISLDSVDIELDTLSELSGKAFLEGAEFSMKIDAREIVACEVLKKKSRNRTKFRIINYTEDASGSPVYKNNDFECDSPTAEKIVHKLHCVLEVRSSGLRKEYLENLEKEKKKTGMWNWLRFRPR